MTDKRIKNETKDTGLTASFTPKAALEHITSKPVITVDYEKYAHLLDDPDLSEDQKREFLQAVWNIITNFVDLGFGVHPVQLACGESKNSCGESTKNHAVNTIPQNNALKSQHTYNTEHSTNRRANRTQEETHYE